MKKGNITIIKGKKVILRQSDDDIPVCRKCCFYTEYNNACSLYFNPSSCTAKNGQRTFYEEVVEEEEYDDFIIADEAREMQKSSLPDITPILEEISTNIKSAALRGEDKIYYSNHLLYIADVKEKVVEFVMSKGFIVSNVNGYNNEILIQWTLRLGTE